MQGSHTLSTRLSRGQQENIKKVAVMMQQQQQALFIELDQHRPLSAIISDIADKWTLPFPEDYALQFSDSNRQTYITETNRSEIQNGNVLQLTASPAKTARNIVVKLQQDNTREEKLSALKRLAPLSADVTFAEEFIQRKGLQILIDFVVAGSQFLGDPLVYTLKSFIALMDHGIVSWDILEPDFTSQIADCLCGQSIRKSLCLQEALEILESFLSHSTNAVKHEAVQRNVTPEKIISYLQSQTSAIQKHAIALLNAMFINATADKKKNIADCLHTRHFRMLLKNGILSSSRSISHEMAHHLSVLQRLMLNLYEDRMNSTVDRHNAAQVATVSSQIEELRVIALEFTDVSVGVPSRKSTISKDWKRLGFSSPTNPAWDFEASPPGLLALENMLYFAHDHKECYIRVVLENGRLDEHDCPFAKASIQLTKLLCQLLRIGELPGEDEQLYFPMLFTVDKPLEECFSICIQTLARTWRDMRASQEDFPKVLSVVQEQIVRALDKHHMPKNFETFKAKLSALTYLEIKKIWDAETQEIDKHAAQTKPIQELRQVLKPEMMALIKKNRLHHLEKGSRFNAKYDGKGQRVKPKPQYWRLSQNHKSLHFGDCTESGSGLPNIEQLQSKVLVSDIKQVLTGREAPHVKSGREKNADLAFAIEVDTNSGESTVYPFTAKDELEYDTWLDGLNCLLSRPMSSGQTYSDLDTLLEMEVKLRLLETEGITIPKDPPPIPPPPDNYNFIYPIA